MALRSMAPSGVVSTSAPPGAFAALLAHEKELSPAFLSSLGAAVAARASLDDVQAELASFRRATDEYAAAARRFQASVGRALDAHGVGEQMGAPCTAAVSALHEWLVSAVEQRLPAYLDRLDTGLSSVIAPAYEGALLHQKRVLDALLLRQAHAEAADGLSGVGGARLEAVVRAVGANNAHGEAAAAFARREGEAMAALSRARGVATLELLRGLSDVCWAQSDCAARGAEAAGAAAEATAEAAATAAVSLDVGGGSESGGGGGVGSPLKGVADAFEGGAEGVAAVTAAEPLTAAAPPPPPLMPKPPRGGREAAPAPTGAAAVPLLPGEVVIREEPAKNERTGQLGALLATRYRLLWAPAAYRAGAGGGDEGGEGGSAGALAASSSSSGNSVSVGSSSSSAASAWAAAWPALCCFGAPVGHGVVSLPLSAVAQLEAMTPPGAAPPPASSGGGGSGGGGGGGGGGERPSASMLVAVTTDLRVGCFSLRGEGTAAALVAALAPFVWAKVPAFAELLAGALPPAGRGARPGWELHARETLEAEAARMRALWRGEADASSRSPLFRISTANDTFALCSTYPSSLLVPSGVPDSALAPVARFRSRGRLPAVVWFSGSVSLSRASQPRAGVFAARSGDDERFLGALLSQPQHVAELRALNGGGPAGEGGGGAAALGAPPAAGASSIGASGDELLLHIMDARPFANAAANTLRGGGAESIANYRGCALSYLNIDNIHVVRDALAALRLALLRAARADLQKALLRAAEGPAGGSEGAGAASPGAPREPPRLTPAATPNRRASSAGRAGGGGIQFAAAEGGDEGGEGRSFFFSQSGGGGGGSGDGEGGGGGGGASTLTPQRRATSIGSGLSALAVGTGLAAMRGEGGGEEAGGGGGGRPRGPPGKPRAGPLVQLVKATRKLLTGSVKTKAEKAAKEDEFLAFSRAHDAAAAGEAEEDAALFAYRATRGASMAEGLGWEGGEVVAAAAATGAGAGAGAGAAPATPRGEGGAPTGGALAAPRAPKAKAAPPWFKLLAIFIEGGVRVARSLLDGVSVCVHCSDGWDRTSGLTSLAMLLIDPHYRTLDGFCVLVAREWCTFGHRFGWRCGTGSPDKDHERRSAGDDQRAPIFLQFLDAVWQLTRQFPRAFEFSDRALAALAEHSYGGAFGTFLADSEAQRGAAGLPLATASVWDHLRAPSRRAAFTNPRFAPAPPPAPAGAAGGPALPSRAHFLPARHDVTAIEVWPFWPARWIDS